MDLIAALYGTRSSNKSLNPYSNGWEKPCETSEEVLLSVTEGGAKRHLRRTLPAQDRTSKRFNNIPQFDLSEVGGRRSDHTSAGVASLHQTVTYLGRFHRPSCPTDSRLFPCFNGAMNLINSSLTHWNNLIYVLILILMEQCI